MGSAVFSMGPLPLLALCLASSLVHSTGLSCVSTGHSASPGLWIRKEWEIQDKAMSLWMMASLATF